MVQANNKEITVTLTEKSHKHAEMMIHKAVNPELVIFYKYSGEWTKANDPSWAGKEYFLCHPNHEKECLHCLNGGDVQINGERFAFSDSIVWHSNHPFMYSEARIRIKQDPEYVKVFFERLSDEIKAWEDGELYIIHDGSYYKLQTAKEVLECKGRLYRKVEKGE